MNSKKLHCTVLLALVLVLCMSFAVFADGGHVIDAIQAFTEEEKAELENYAEKLTEQYGCGVYIAVMNDFTAFTDSGSIREAAKVIYESRDMGVGSDKSGILLTLSMEARDYNILVHGYGNTAFTDYGREYLEDEFLPYFGDDDWYGGFEAYFIGCERILEDAASGEIFDAGSNVNRGMAWLKGIAIGAAIGFLIAFLVTGSMKAKLKSVAAGSEASAYVTGQGLNLRVKTDSYTHTTQSRVYVPPKNDSSSGGGTSVGSDGYSSSSGKF